MGIMIRDYLKNWNDVRDDRVKLQHSYAAIALLALVLAGLFGLVNYTVGQNLLLVALAFGILFVINAVAWALIHSFILSGIDRRQSISPTRKK